MRRLTALASTALLLLVTGCGEAGKAPSPKAERMSHSAPYDVRPLLKPKKKYLGVAYEGAGRPDDTGLKTFARLAGKKANLVPIYSEFDDLYPAEKVSSLWAGGALPLVVWEPYKSTLRDIAAGVRDVHVHTFAEAVRALDIPVVLSFGHEMNGHWYPWGTKKATAEEYIAAYRHVHDVFTRVGATNAIWLWSPNVLINNSMRLRPYFPGAAYVDWVGPIGYFEWSNDSRSFEELFGPPIKAMRKFTDLPVLIPETAAPPTVNKPGHIADLYAEIARRDDIIGVVWFNIKKERDWRVNSSRTSLNAFRKAVADPVWSFDPRKAG
ncbi:beta-mannanase [Actinocorallia sp. API 0066]|uniref:glycoside hydrolase family 26 protein n=1 Tax=Actinocorallia sp. API 0066 TaxID=2896846 RepID=UPI001E53B13C|nr:glycosyl hydrolase [Actinocorallia sp. API 0066]MCD0451080.1 beta-mannanase [Actinocorallia sp. API 0066]